MDVGAKRLQTIHESDGLLLEASGSWNIEAVESLEPELRQVGAKSRAGKRGQAKKARIDLTRVDSLDSAGAWLVVRTREGLSAAGIPTQITGATTAYQSLIERIEKARECEAPKPKPPPRVLDMLANMGRVQFEVLGVARKLVGFYGLTLMALGRTLIDPRRLRFTALVYRMQVTGLNAMPIVGLLAFLIGIVVAFLGADSLAKFGAQIITIDMVGILTLRETGALITAILIAGRSGSAFTAQIGTMKVNQEIDAMQTIGLDVVEVLVVPRVLALMITLPLLVFFANIMGLLGGLIMATVALDISITTFLKHLQNAVSLNTFMVGMIKAPVFAFIIALVGCFEGFNVSGNAESVGQKTTASVVEAIFLVIVFDAAFAILFSVLGI